MSRPAYYGRPALVAGYPWHAPVGVQVVALVQYLGAVLLIAAAGVATLIARGVTRYAVVNRIPEPVRHGVAGGGLVIPITLAVLGLFWFVIAHHLELGRQWARATVLILSLLSGAALGYDAWRSRDVDLLLGLALPLLYLMLLNTRAARSWFRYGSTT
jgi:hypothetical protein